MNLILDSAAMQSGFTVVILGIFAVLFTFCLLTYTFRILLWLLSKNIRTKLRKEGKIEEAESKNLIMEGDINAAISMALYLYFSEDHHDVESNIVTIKRLSRRYSPWSSKIYNVIDRIPKFK